MKMYIHSNINTTSNGEMMKVETLIASIIIKAIKVFSMLRNQAHRKVLQK
jgi:hypothetical protein